MQTSNAQKPYNCGVASGVHETINNPNNSNSNNNNTYNSNNIMFNNNKNNPITHSPLMASAWFADVVLPSAVIGNSTLDLGGGIISIPGERDIKTSREEVKLVGECLLKAIDQLGQS
jgi:hypothetical protein